MNFDQTQAETPSVIIAPPADERVMDVRDLDFFYGKTRALH